MTRRVPSPRNADAPPLYGLLLTGGASSRMGCDKALLPQSGKSQLETIFERLEPHVQRCFVSLRKDQTTEPVRARFPCVVDELDDIGPAAGLLAARRAYPESAWLVVACDLPLLQDATLGSLVEARGGQRMAIAYRSPFDGLPEPLCALWEPQALEQLAAQVQEGRHSLRHALASVDAWLLPAPADGTLDNINTPEDRARLRKPGDTSAQ